MLSQAHWKECQGTHLGSKLVSVQLLDFRASFLLDLRLCQLPSFVLVKTQSAVGKLAGSAYGLVRWGGKLLVAVRQFAKGCAVSVVKDVERSRHVGVQTEGNSCKYGNGDYLYKVKELLSKDDRTPPTLSVADSWCLLLKGLRKPQSSNNYCLVRERVRSS